MTLSPMTRQEVGGSASANTVRGRSGKHSGTEWVTFHFGPLQKASGPRKKAKTAMSHFWDTHHIAGAFEKVPWPKSAQFCDTETA